VPALFVYGTLRPDGSNHGLLERVVSDVELAHADGLALYAARGFPYAAPDPSPNARITGAVCVIDDRAWPTALTRLDRLEGYQPDREAASHYLRRLRPVVTASGVQTEAWIYLAGPHVDLTRYRRIPSGDWHHQLTTSQ